MRPIFFAAAALGALTVAGPVAADAGFFGTSGIFIAPTAEVRPRAGFAVGANYVAARYRKGAMNGSDGTVAQYVAVGLLDNVEISAALLNLQGKFGIQRLPATNSQDGWNVDRTFCIHALAYKGGLGRPSFAVGARDLFGEAIHNRSYYAVATQGLGPVRLSAGYGSDSLGGVFFGLEAPLGPRGRALLEQVDGNTNVGLRWQLLSGLQADLAMMGGRSLAGGLSWRSRMW
jgi:Exopolysaccharide biosynthesis protein YbjH